MQGADLSGIHLVEKDINMIENARKEIESQAQKMLAQGMESQSQTQVATALQVGLCVRVWEWLIISRDKVKILVEMLERGEGGGEGRNV